MDRPKNEQVTDFPEVMNVHQCAAYLQLSVDTIHRYAAEGKVPCFKLGNRWRFKKTRIDQWISESIEQNRRLTTPLEGE